LLTEPSVHETELAAADDQWNTLLTLELVPHPDLKHKEAIELDYAMTDGVKTIQIRAAMAGYLLRLWNVDCSLEYRGNQACQLALKNSVEFHQLMLSYPSFCLAPH